MTRIIRIECCGECPYIVSRRGLMSNYLECSKLIQHIENKRTVLPNCPLEILKLRVQL